VGKLLLIAAAALGGVAVWRRKTLQSDAKKMTELAKSNAAKAGEAAKSGVAKVKKDSSEAEAEGDAEGETTSDDVVAEVSDEAAETTDA
jgi:hypothetical protein